MEATKWGIRMKAEKSNESDLPEAAKSAETLGLASFEGGQRKPRCCPEDCPHINALEFTLGDAMDIVDVAAIFGCSAWTIRQKYMKQGLPCLRTSRTGKFLFFRRQVLDWILKQQRKEEWK